ncbi:DUF3099 domain-containing protein [Corynebacterium sp.]|uniref:DUF3099 domain-containing protein n=1 Tax=Corynebacterium sp. TaxID=1720 RepID=UPI0026DC6737|nr:DUF3099 domain-containing protein [Corynebacterium sp.]MDO5031711.1 DUF3099 domain-containing protein [Corynebacterium sp.]
MHPQNSRDGSDHTPVSGRRHGFKFRREAHLITDAQVGPGQDRERREVIYGILQFIRIPSLIIAGVAIYYWQAWLIAAIVVGVTFPLPWIAVMIGNGRGQPKDKREKAIYKPAIARQMAQAQREELTQPTRRQLGAGDSNSASAPHQDYETIDHEDTPPAGHDPTADAGEDSTRDEGRPHEQ